MWGNDPLPSQSIVFIGREREIAEIAALLVRPECRLLTLVGPGGIGKTRLAMETVQQVQTAFAEGALFVPLAPISDAANIPTTIAGTFKINLDANADAATQILNYLHDRTLLLVLDNFEHLSAGGGDAAGGGITPNGVFKGTEQIREFFTQALAILTPEVLSSLKMARQDMNGEYAYILWSAGAMIPFGSDSFYIHDGKIVMQSFARQFGA